MQRVETQDVAQWPGLTRDSILSFIRLVRTPSPRTVIPSPPPPQQRFSPHRTHPPPQPGYRPAPTSQSLRGPARRASAISPPEALRPLPPPRISAATSKSDLLPREALIMSCSQEEEGSNVVTAEEGPCQPDVHAPYPHQRRPGCLFKTFLFLHHRALFPPPLASFDRARVKGSFTAVKKNVQQCTNVLIFCPWTGLRAPAPYARQSPPHF